MFEKVRNKGRLGLLKRNVAFLRRRRQLRWGKESIESQGFHLLQIIFENHIEELKNTG